MYSRGFGEISQRYDAPNDIQKEYNEWLMEKTGLSNHNFRKLAEALINKDFYYFIENDMNRYIDGLDIRKDFAYDTLYDDYNDINGPCNCLEMIYGLAKRMNNIIYDPDFPEDETEDCLYCMLQNLGLLIFDDQNFEKYGGIERVNYILEVFLERSYDYYGNGGLFPNQNARKDQRNVEIWYQMSEYINENFM